MSCEQFGCIRKLLGSICRNQLGLERMCPRWGICWVSDEAVSSRGMLTRDAVGLAFIEAWLKILLKSLSCTERILYESV